MVIPLPPIPVQQPVRPPPQQQHRQSKNFEKKIYSKGNSNESLLALRTNRKRKEKENVAGVFVDENHRASVEITCR